MKPAPPPIVTDPRVRAVQWRDLTVLTRSDVARELSLSLPWLGLSLLCARQQWHIPALAASFVFFLTGLRQVHNAHHYALGLSRAATEWVMCALSIAMLGSMHAIQVTHLLHHRHVMDDEDVEAMSARMRWWQALLFGPAFPVMLHVKAWRVANRRQRRWIAGELAGTAAIVLASWALVDWHALRYHVAAMAAGQCLTGFFAVWTVHHDCDRYHHIARTVRSRFKNAVTFSMFFHVEHHLFPAVPTSRLHVLAARLDAAAPELCSKRVF
jgi:fatty acid desaturase